MFELGEPKLVIEIYDCRDSIFTGITHLYYEGDKYEHYKMVGRYFKKDLMLMMVESVTIAVDLGNYGNCLGTYMTTLKKKGTDLLQDGIWISNIRGCSPTTKIYLKKRVEEIKQQAPAAKKLPVTKKPETPNAVKGKVTTAIAKTTVTPLPPSNKTPIIKPAPARLPSQLTQRETDVQSLLEIDMADKDSIKVEVYDNGDIDGDSVSVYEEVELRINKKMITAKPITFYVSLDKNSNPISHLRLVAESLGSIPPCTALMIVTTKSKRYEVRLSSNFKKNATLELFLKE
jgi:hypothetical protein